MFILYFPRGNISDGCCNYTLLLAAGAFDLLCIGLLQESTPELTLIRRAEVDQFVVHSGQQVIDPHLFPLAVYPELHTGETKRQGVLGNQF